MNAHIERASEADRPSILQLLRDAQLPVDGLVEHLSTAFVARDGAAIVGCAALEIYPEGALLRSVVVAPVARGHGLGKRLTKTAITLAQSLRMPAVYLLTTTAASYFPRFGFVQMTREQVPRSVQQSVEFRSACPASAVVMGRTLSDSSIVCTLQPGELNARANRLLPGVVAAASARQAIENGFRFEFRPDGDVLASIVRMIDAERQCCRFLRFQLTVEPAHGPVVLEVTGPPGSQEFLDAMIESARPL